jgi:hypothetical protein
VSDSSNKHKHLEFIQLTITRMAANSALLRGWTITLVAAIFALSDAQVLGQFFFVAIIPVVAFWILDGYYLSQERQFRELYNAIRQKQDGDIDYDLDTRQFAKNEWKLTWFGGIVAAVNIVFYCVVVALILTVIFGTPHLEKLLKGAGNTPAAPADEDNEAPKPT